MTGLLPLWQPSKVASAMQVGKRGQGGVRGGFGNLDAWLSSPTTARWPAGCGWQKPADALQRYAAVRTTADRMTRTVTAVRIARPARTASVMRMTWRAISAAWMIGRATAR